MTASRSRACLRTDESALWKWERFSQARTCQSRKKMGARQPVITLLRARVVRELAHLQARGSARLSRVYAIRGHG
jgi:hypothetical protein